LHTTKVLKGKGEMEGRWEMEFLKQESWRKGNKKATLSAWPLCYAVNNFFNSSTSTFLMTGVRVNCLMRFTRAFATALFLLSFRFNRVTPIAFEIWGAKMGNETF